MLMFRRGKENNLIELTTTSVRLVPRKNLIVTDTVMIMSVMENVRNILTNPTRCLLLIDFPQSLQNYLKLNLVPTPVRLSVYVICSTLALLLLLHSLPLITTSSLLSMVRMMLINYSLVP